jgi:hypothetical protein
MVIAIALGLKIPYYRHKLAAFQILARLEEWIGEIMRDTRRSAIAGLGTVFLSVASAFAMEPLNAAP